MIKILVVLAAIAIAVGASIGVACLFAWGITSIWPSLPFWPVAFAAWAFSALFAKSSSN